MNVKKLLCVFVVAVAAGVWAAFADPVISDITVKQRWPWNGRVDIDYTLVAETTEVFNHHRLPFCETRVTNQHGELLCIVTGSAYRKKDILPYDKLQ